MARPAVRNSTSWPDFSCRRVIRHAAASLGVIAALFAGPAAAQNRPVEPQLEELIPDEAVEDPEGWAARAVPAAAIATDDVLPELDADSLLDAIPLVEAPWPDLADMLPPDPVEAEAGIEFHNFAESEEGKKFALDDGEEEQVSDELVLAFPADVAQFPDRAAFLERFRMLSTIRQLDDGDSVARLAAQARADEKLLQRLLRNFGHYDGQVLRSISGNSPSEEARADRPEVRFDILPGAQFHFGVIDLGTLDAAGPDSLMQDYSMLRGAFEIQPGDRLNSDKIVQERSDLDLVLGETGYPFAIIQPPELLIDHARQEGDLAMPVEPGGKYRFGKVVSSLPGLMSDSHLAEIARFRPGEIYQRSLAVDLRRALLATGLVSSAELIPVEAEVPTSGEPGTVDMQVQMTRAKLRTIAGGIGYGTGEGFKAQASWEHRNLFPSEGMLRLRGIAGTQEQLLGATFRKNNFRGRDRILTIDSFASTIDYDAYDARTLSVVSTYEQVSNLLFQKPFSWGVGVELVASRQAEQRVQGVVGPRETYLIAALPAHGQFDTSDDLLDPTEGYRLRGAISPEYSRANGNGSTYLKVQFDLAHYQKFGDGVVLAARARAGSIGGAPLASIAPSRRFYAGGGGSVRGYGYQAIGPRNGAGTPNGGRSLVEFSVEARIRTGLMDGALGIVPFIDAGAVNLGTTPDFTDIRVGAGVGLRYYTDFGPLRLDIGIPLNPGPDDGPVGIYVALGQAF